MWKAVKRPNYRRRMSCSNSSYSYREVIMNIGPPFWQNSSSKKGLQQTRKHQMNSKERTSCRLRLRR